MTRIAEKRLGTGAIAGDFLRLPPTATITSPGSTVSSGSLTVSWTYSSPVPRAQASYRVQLFDQSGDNALFDSGELEGTATSYIVDFELTPTSSYQVQVTVSDGIDLSTAVSDFTYDTGQPAGSNIEPRVGSVYEAAINGVGVMLADLPSGERRYRRRIVPLDSPRLATSETPFSQAIERYTNIGLVDWSAGAGQRVADRTSSSPSAYDEADRIDPFTPGRMALAPASRRVLACSNADVRSVVAGGKLYTVTGSAQLTSMTSPDDPAPISFTVTTNTSTTPPPADPDDPPPTGTGVFTIDADGFIIDPAGYRFTPTGANVAGNIPLEAGPGDWWYDNITWAYGHSQDALDWGWNMVRLQVIEWADSGWTQEQVFAGLFATVDEYISKGIVCTFWVGPFTADENNPASNPTVSEVEAHPWVLDLYDQIIARYKDHPLGHYVWLNALNEPFMQRNDDGSGLGSGWEVVQEFLYDRAIAAGWPHFQLFDLWQYGQAIRQMVETTQVTTWLADKPNAIISWHNYDSGSDAELADWTAEARALNIPFICGEFGFRNGGGSADFGYDGSKWMFANAWDPSISVGGLWWLGAGLYSNTFTLRQRTGGAWYDASPALNEGGQLLYEVGTSQGWGGGPGSLPGEGGGTTPPPTGGGGGQVIVTQDFSTGSTMSDIGWSNLPAPGPHGVGQLTTGQISGGVVQALTADDDCYLFPNTALNSADHYVEATVKVGSAGVRDDYTGVFVRGNMTNYSWWKMETCGSSTTVRLISLINGALGPEYYTSQTFSANTDYVFRLEARGSRIIGFVDGVQKFDVDASSLTTQQVAGIEIGNNTSLSPRGTTMDNAEVGNFLPASGGGSSGGTGGGSTPGTGTGNVFVNVSPVKALATDGEYWYWADGQRIVRNNRAADPGVIWSSSKAEVMEWCSDRMVIARPGGSSATPNVVAVLAQNGTEVGGSQLFTMPAGTTVTGITSGDGHVWWAATRNDISAVYAWRLGSTESYFTALELPAGQQAVAISYYLGNVFVRSVDTAGRATIYRCAPSDGALSPFKVLTIDDPAIDHTIGTFAGDESRVYFSWRQAGLDTIDPDRTASGVGAVDLAGGGWTRWSVPDQSGTEGTGAVRSITLWQGKLVYTVDEFGVIVEDDVVATSGALESSLIDLGTGLKKVFSVLDVTFDPLPLGGSITVEYSIDGGGTYIALPAVTQAGRKSASFTIDRESDVISIRTVLRATRGFSPVVRTMTLRAYPIGLADQVLVMPINCSDQTAGLNGQLLPGSGKGAGARRARWAESLAQSRVTVQDVDWPVTNETQVYDVIAVDVESVGVFDPAVNRQSQAMVATVTMRRSFQ
jgi:hypothetical protein